MTKSKGFTIIELIVVIAIIAVLASVVLVNVTSYINKGKDSAIKGNMASAMTTAAGYYDTNSNYTSLATADTTYAAVLTAMGGAGGTVTHYEIATAYCLQSTLLGGGSWCVDSTGYKGSTANCDLTTADCAAD